jgi:uncharacterized protein YjbJ (UPF0337 family)
MMAWRAPNLEQARYSAPRWRSSGAGLFVGTFDTEHGCASTRQGHGSFGSCGVQTGYGDLLALQQGISHDQDSCRSRPRSRSVKEVITDWNRVEGNWKQVKGAVKQQWGKLTDDDLTQVDRSRERLGGIIQERYGIARDETRKLIDAWYQRQGW